MSDETEMNAAQADLENQLKQTKLATVSIDRDELMYQSGWKAALTSISNEESKLATRPVQDRNWVWKASTLLMSAATIVLACVLHFGDGAKFETARVGTEESNSSRLPVTRNDERQLATNRGAGDWVDRDRAERAFEQVDFVQKVLEYPSGLVLQSGLAFQASPSAIGWVQPFQQTDLEPAKRSPPTTQRQLMNRLLPKRERPDASSWRNLFSGATHKS